MNTVELYIDGKWVKINTSECNDSYRRYPARCPECKQPAILCHGPERGLYFRSDLHLPSCGMASGGRTFTTHDGYVFKLKNLLNACDGPYVPPKENMRGEGAETSRIIDDKEQPVDNCTKTSKMSLRTCSTMYKACANMPADHHITPTLTVGSFMVREDTIEQHRMAGLTGVHMLIAVRFNFKAMEPPLPPDKNFIYLRDPYTWGKNNAIYYKIRFAEKTQHRHFLENIFSERNSGRIFVFVGKVKRVQNKNYTIYEVSPLASMRFCITGKIK